MEKVRWRIVGVRRATQETCLLTGGIQIGVNTAFFIGSTEGGVTRGDHRLLEEEEVIRRSQDVKEL